MHELHSCGLLHSDIPGSLCACHSPRLFAAYRVLHRLLMPRHPPCALISLNSLFAELCLVLFFQNFFFRRSWNCILPFFLEVLPSVKIGYLIISSLLFRYSIFKDLSSPSDIWSLQALYMVGWNGLEPSTSRLSAECSNQLSYQPILPYLLSGGD